MNKEKFEEQKEENFNGCSGYCAGCERFKEDAPTFVEGEGGVPTSPKESVGKKSEKTRSKESSQEEKFDKFLREFKKKKEEEKKEYKRKKPRK